LESTQQSAKVAMAVQDCRHQLTAHLLSEQAVVAAELAPELSAAVVLAAVAMGVKTTPGHKPKMAQPTPGAAVVAAQTPPPMPQAPADLVSSL
jgi:hypothetical protein